MFGRARLYQVKMREFKKFEARLASFVRAHGQTIYLIKLLISANLFVHGAGKVYSLGINISFVNLIANYGQRWNERAVWARLSIDAYRLCVKVHRESITLSLGRKYRRNYSNYFRCRSFRLNFSIFSEIFFAGRYDARRSTINLSFPGCHSETSKIINRIHEKSGMIIREEIALNDFRFIQHRTE